MEEQIQRFITYLQQFKELSENTVLSYRRDLQQLRLYMEKEQGITDFQDVTSGHLEAYFNILRQQKKSSTISRHMSSVRALYRYLLKMCLVKEDVTQQLQTPTQHRTLPEC